MAILKLSLISLLFVSLGGCAKVPSESVKISSWFANYDVTTEGTTIKCTASFFVGNPNGTYLELNPRSERIFCEGQTLEKLSSLIDQVYYETRISERGREGLPVTFELERTIDGKTSNYPLSVQPLPPLDSMGLGFWAVGLGILVTKIFPSYDVFVLGTLRDSFEKSIESEQFQGKLVPGLGGYWGFGGGFSIQSWRFGTEIGWSYEDPVELRGSITQSGSSEGFTNAKLSLGYLKNQNWAGSVSYTDQTLFGDPKNTSLGRTIGFALQRRWER